MPLLNSDGQKGREKSQIAILDTQAISVSFYGPGHKLSELRSQKWSSYTYAVITSRPCAIAVDAAVRVVTRMVARAAGHNNRIPIFINKRFLLTSPAARDPPVAIPRSSNVVLLRLLPSSVLRAHRSFVVVVMLLLFPSRALRLGLSVSISSISSL